MKIGGVYARVCARLTLHAVYKLPTKRAFLDSTTIRIETLLRRADCHNTECEIMAAFSNRILYAVAPFLAFCRRDQITLQVRDLRNDLTTFLKIHKNGLQRLHICAVGK